MESMDYVYTEEMYADDVTLEKVAIMIELIMTITNCRYSDAYKIITKSNVYSRLVSKEYSNVHDSPQANLSSIGVELRANIDHLGDVITDENIIKAFRKLRDINLKNKK